MEPISKDWLERLEKAKTNEEFINLLNEIPLSQSIPLTGEDSLDSSIMELRPQLIPVTLTTKGD